MAAGLGFKDFVTGEVLTAADVDGYLMQNIWVFANATARDAAVTSPQEGNACYLKDTDAVMTYSGSAWVTASAATSYGYAAGKNSIINGAFNIWQRGTSFSPTPGVETYTADRWVAYVDGTTTSTFSRQTFTPGTAPVAGYEGSYFYRAAITSQTGGSGTYIYQKIEDVRTFAGQTVTMSFWAKAAATGSSSIYLTQNFGSGGSATVNGTASTISLTTSWQRFTYTVAVPSISGKTIGTSSFLSFYIQLTANLAQTVDIWGAQVESGSTATAFQTATGTIQGELAACQRYYWRPSGQSAYAYYAGGVAESGTVASILLPTPVNLRSPSTASVDYSTLAVGDASGTLRSVTSITINHYQSNCLQLLANVASGLTQYRPASLLNNNSTSAYVAISSEL
jgi:hypothetical protein